MLKGTNKIRKNTGQTLVELAIILPVLVALIFGMTDFGRVLNGYMVATQASREGARAAVLGADNAAVEIKVRTAASTLDQAQLIVATTPATRTRGDSVTVAITYNVDIVTPLINTMLSDPFPVNCQTVMRIE